LILNEAGTSYSLINLVDQAIRNALVTFPYRIEFYREYMDTALFPDSDDQQRFRDFYIRKYQYRKPDVIITVGPAPLRFMMEAHARFFAGVPVVFCIPNGVPVSPSLYPEFTGVETEIAPAETLAAALRLRSGTEHVVVVGGVAAYDRQQQALVREKLRAYQDHFDISYLTALSMPELLERLKQLPSHTIVLMSAISQDASGVPFTASEAGPKVVAASNAPVFSWSDRFFNHGEVGGAVSSVLDQGRAAGGMVLRMLNGEKPQDIPHIRTGAVLTFDWRALKRWGLKESALPPGSVVLNRQPSVWESYRAFIIGGVSLILAQALLIFGLVWQRARRRKVEAELAATFEVVRESEQRFRLVSNTAPVMIWMSGPDNQRTYFNQPWLEFTGRSLEAELGNGWSEGVYSADLQICLDTYTRAFDRREPLKMQYRLRRKDGEHRWIFDIGVPRFHDDGSFAGYIGSAIDVTERKKAEEALSSVSRKLIEAQEAERTRIARELHDDINQRLVLSQTNLTALRKSLPEEAEASRRIEEALACLAELGDDIQRLSHRLHSSRLEYLGLVAASAGFCAELSERQKVEIDFRSDSVPQILPSEISLCLFRVLQEALQNAIKHSGARQFQVSLARASNEIQLSVRDSGVGFDPNTASRGPGLGLTSMKERLRLVEGQISIESKPQHGTTILARVPLDPKMTAAEVVA
jgi:PAS domain S-box-containing protein